MTWERCKIGGRLVLITNRKSHMGFRLLLKSVTLNDLERRNDRVVCVISPTLLDSETYYEKVVEDTQIHLL